MTCGTPHLIASILSRCRRTGGLIQRSKPPAARTASSARHSWSRNEEGLTKTYNRFHDPEERDSEIVNLRELHAAMDRVVLDAYGWRDISTDCEFVLDYEIDEEEWGVKKRPYRYRWPDEVRDKTLARLLELNAERAKEEARSGTAKAKQQRNKTVAKRTPRGLARGPLLADDANREQGACRLPEVRARLVEALKLDLVGPWAGPRTRGRATAGLGAPSNWYLTGFLIPSGTTPKRAPTQTRTTTWAARFRSQRASPRSLTMSARPRRRASSLPRWA